MKQINLYAEIDALRREVTMLRRTVNKLKVYAVNEICQHFHSMMEEEQDNAYENSYKNAPRNVRRASKTPRQSYKAYGEDREI